MSSPDPPTALVAAGGSGERMRRSGSSLSKPLVLVDGTALVDHNVAALANAGIVDVRVAVSTNAEDVQAHVTTVTADLAERLGVDLSVIQEDPPLGSIGAAGLIDDVDEVLVVNADNLTSLDLRAMVDRHRDEAAAMTLAVHDEPFPMPFGEITTEGGRVLRYREKPTYTITICSAVTLLGAPALGLFRPGEFVMLPAFANRVLDAGLVVAAFHHDAAWVDVNELGQLPRAEQVLAAMDAVDTDRSEQERTT